MKKYIIAIFACCWAIFSSCSDDDKLPNINPAATGEYTDERDGNTYGWVRIGDLEWMTSNLKYYPEAPITNARTIYSGLTMRLRFALISSISISRQTTRNMGTSIPGKKLARFVPKVGVCQPTRTGKIWK